jgi:hypothetical protein
MNIDTADRDSIEYLDTITGFWDGADAINEWLDKHPGKLHNCSTIARGAKVDYILTCRILDYLDRHSYVAASGNKSWRKYGAR